LSTVHCSGDLAEVSQKRSLSFALSRYTELSATKSAVEGQSGPQLRDAANAPITIPRPARTTAATIGIIPLCFRSNGISATITARHAAVGSTRTEVWSTPLARDRAISVNAWLLFGCLDTRQNLPEPSQVRSSSGVLPRPSDGLRLVT